MLRISLFNPRRRVDTIDRLILLFDEYGHLQVENAKYKWISARSNASIHKEIQKKKKISTRPR
jgi:hypothetical protein